MANDSDPDGDPLVLSGYTNGTYGSVTLNTAPNSATFTYTPIYAMLDYLAPGESVNDTIAYFVSDGNGESDSATVTITITE